MGTNHHTAYSNVAPKTAFTVASMGAPLSELDRAITYADKRIIACDGAVSWAAGTLTWSGTIHIWFNSAAGLAIHNTIAAGSIALADDEIAYVTLDETNDAALTVAKDGIVTAAASNYLACNILVLGIRNAGDDKFYPAALSGPMQIAALDVANALLYKGVIDCSGNPNYPAADAGHVYIVSVSGKIGGASGASVAVGDLIICNTDATAGGDQAGVGAKWNIIEKTMDAAELAAIISAQDDKTTPAAADKLVMLDSEDGDGVKTITIDNLKTGISTPTPAASVIPRTDGSGKLDTWVSDAITAVKGKLVTAGNAKALAGTDTASAVTPDDLKFVLGHDYTYPIQEITEYSEAQ